MISILLIAAAAYGLFRLLGGVAQLRVRHADSSTAAVSKIDELTEYAARLRATNKYTAAEKVYLQILKIDHRHVATYSRLGTLYTAQKNYNDAIECFEMANKLNPSGSTFYNLGLAYYENRNLMKAIAMLEKSTMLEPTVQRYIALAKALSKMGNGKRVIATLEQAANIDESTKVLWLLVDAYAAGGRSSELPGLYARIRAIDPADKRLKPVSRPRTARTAPRI